MEINWTIVITSTITGGFTLAAAIVAWRLRLREARSLRVQEKQCQAIGDMYGLLINVLEAASHVLNPIPTPSQLHKEKRPSFLEAWDALYRFFTRSRLYFDEQVCGDMEALHRHLTAADVNSAAWHDKGEIPYEDRLKSALSNEAIRKAIDHICQRLEEHFRKLLGTLS
ncbi:MAG TPA: hypothetical protein VMG10_02330 [Gemmataceae bacterium]|nr:hypothetical protein [Gemmataceae bacterium]